MSIIITLFHLDCCLLMVITSLPFLYIPDQQLLIDTVLDPWYWGWLQLQYMHVWTVRFLSYDTHTYPHTVIHTHTYQHTVIHTHTGARMSSDQIHGCQLLCGQIHRCSTARCTDVQRSRRRMSINQVHRCPSRVHNVGNNTSLKWWVCTGPDPLTTAVGSVRSHNPVAITVNLHLFLTFPIFRHALEQFQGYLYNNVIINLGWVPCYSLITTMLNACWVLWHLSLITSVSFMSILALYLYNQLNNFYKNYPRLHLSFDCRRWVAYHPLCASDAN